MPWYVIFPAIMPHPMLPGVYLGLHPGDSEYCSVQMEN